MCVRVTVCMFVTARVYVCCMQVCACTRSHEYSQSNHVAHTRTKFGVHPTSSNFTNPRNPINSPGSYGDIAVFTVSSHWPRWHAPRWYRLSLAISVCISTRILPTTGVMADAAKGLLPRRTNSYSEAIARASAEEPSRGTRSDAGADVTESELQAHRAVTTDEVPNANVSVRMKRAAALTSDMT